MLVMPLRSRAKSDRSASRPLILIIDDEVDLCRIMEIALKERGYQVQSRHDGRAGLRALAELRPALLLLDIKMPLLNGFELLVKMRKDSAVAGIPVIVLTSLSENEGLSDEEWARRMEVAGFISKPFDPERALDMVDRVLNGISIPGAPST
jgi:DNA-binding response OmpR family regulator